MDLRLLVGTLFYAAGLPFQTVGRLLGLPDVQMVQRVMHTAVADNVPSRMRQSA